MPPTQDDSAAQGPAPAPGKITVEQMTLAKFNDDQLGALKQANMERTTRGLPQWEIADYVRVHPGKFPEVDHEFDDQQAVERNKTAAKPSAASRVDQRPAG